MLHARVVRPRGQGAYGTARAEHRLGRRELDQAHRRRAQVVRQGDFLAVVAPQEYDAIQAAAQLKVKWAEPPPISSSGNIVQADARPRRAPARRRRAIGVNAATSTRRSRRRRRSSPRPTRTSTTATCRSARRAASRTCARTARSIYHEHAGRATRLRLERCSRCSALPLNNDPRHLLRGRGSFGNGPARYDAARRGGRSRSSRARRCGCSSCAGTSTAGTTTARRSSTDIRGGDRRERARSSRSRRRSSAAPASRRRPTTRPRSSVGMPIGAARTRARSTRRARARSTTSRTGAVIGKTLRGDRRLLQDVAAAGAARPRRRAFASEQMIDELAYAAEHGPDRVPAARTSRRPTRTAWLDALVGAAELANWQPRVAGSNLADGNVVTAAASRSARSASSQAGVVADIEVNKKTGKIIVKHMYGAQDAGLAVYPGLVREPDDGQPRPGRRAGRCSRQVDVQQEAA